MAAGAGAAAAPFGGGAAAAAAASAKVVDPRVDYIDRPLGLETLKPRFSWRLEGKGRGLKQVAYRVQAATSEAALLTGPWLWDSGKVDSDRTFDVAWDGPALASKQRVAWRVGVWTGDAAVPAFSAASSLEMGLLAPDDWKGDWIAAPDPEAEEDRKAGMIWVFGNTLSDPKPRRFRLKFDLPGKPVKAELLVTGKDELTTVWLNGGEVEQPGWQPLWGTMRELDPTARLQAGANVIGLEIVTHADALPKTPAVFSALLRATMADGSVVRVTSSTRWQTRPAEGADWTTDAGWTPVGSSQGWGLSPPWPARPAALLRKSFTTTRPVARARLYATALGGYEAHINGERVGTGLLAPESTDFRKRALYQIHDVTGLIRQGENALGAVLADGWYGSAFSWNNGRWSFGPPPNRLKAQLELTYADGTSEIVASDETWLTGPSPVLSSEIYNGEVHDARREIAGWAAPGFAAEGWARAYKVETPPVALAAQAGPPIRATQRLKATSVKTVAPGVHVYDFGQNFSGWVRLKVKGAAGTRVQLRFAEVVKADGGVDVANLRGARATDAYVLKGQGTEVWEPRFTYHGFRYLELTGYPGAPPKDAIEAVVIHSDCAITGVLRTSDPLIEQVWRNAAWSQRSNLVGLPTDCPQRDERLGWMGDAQVFWNAASFNMDVDAFTRRFMDDARSAQTKDGSFPDVTPFPASWDGSPGWADAGVILPWTLYRQYGDTGVIDQNWEAMEAWLKHIADANPDFIWRNKRGIDYGDWLHPEAVNRNDETTPKALIGTAFWALDADYMTQMAEASGRREAADKYRELRADIGAAFVKAYVKPDGSVGNDSQTSHILALRFGLVPDALRAASAKKLADDVAGRGYRLNTGFLGTPYILDALCDNGHEDVAVALLRQRAFPSWGYMVDKGATSMWERWNGDTGDVAMNSYNHYAFGAVAGFMYRRLAAIEPLEAGFRRIRVRPVVDARLPHGGGTYDSTVGRIVTDWKRTDAGFSLNLTVPPNAEAEVHLPGQAVTEGGKPVGEAGAVRVLRRENDRVVVGVPSGVFRFTSA
ncbi:MAG: family 78 glycoside hydrolase catalytic domain [Caulobacter sp.]|nr:family 78 glycoside hydrolase catalytic domain [Caulobacter sp.]